MARQQKVLPEVEGDSSDGIPLRTRGKQPERVLEEVLKPEESEKHWRSMSPEPRHLPASSVNDEDAPSPGQVLRANRYARYEAVRALHRASHLGSREMARRLHLSRQTVRKFLICESFPQRNRSPYPGSILDPYKPYILERWKAGYWNGSQPPCAPRSRALWRNGPVEAQVNCLQLQKRLMFGRANFDLFRLHVLRRA